MTHEMEELNKQIREVLGVRESAPIISRGFELSELVEFALARHGWADSNGGFGVIYPSDLDDYAREVEGVDIPEGYVEVFGFWGPEKGGYEIKVEEHHYIQELIKILRREGYSEKIKAFESLF